MLFSLPSPGDWILVHSFITPSLMSPVPFFNLGKTYGLGQSFYQGIRGDGDSLLVFHCFNLFVSNHLTHGPTSMLTNVPVKSKIAQYPPQGIPRAFDWSFASSMGNLTQNEALPVGHLTFMSKC